MGRVEHWSGRSEDCFGERLNVQDRPDTSGLVLGFLSLIGDEQTIHTLVVRDPSQPLLRRHLLDRPARGYRTEEGQRATDVLDTRRPPCPSVVQCFFYSGNGIFLEYMRGAIPAGS